MKLPKNTMYHFIMGAVKENFKVLDLGCGDGSLLAALRHDKNIIGHGIDIQIKQLMNCVQKGIPVVQCDLNKLPLDFEDNSYDLVILNQTLQQLNHPEKLILEILRIGNEAILSFPNFGSRGIRWQFLLSGKMPITDELPNKWYNTPNIKLLTIKDFYDFCYDNSIEIIQEAYYKKRKKGHAEIKMFPNWRADIAIFKIKNRT